MPTTSGRFTKFSVSEFETWIAGISVSRTVTRVQQHHTYIPSYSQFNGSNHFSLQSGMRNHHVNNNGWSDIGQHFSIFPDGAIVTGRSLNKSPACIYGANARSICIENVGFFDAGKDDMRNEQKDAVIAVTAAILRRFGAIPQNSTGIVYHHWFDLNTGARRNGAGTTKSCPGTNFFGGNKVADFDANFLPLIKASLSGVAAPTTTVAGDRLVAVTADFLNIRTAPRSSASKINEHGPAELGSILRVFGEEDGWLKISNSKEHWVYGRYTSSVTHAVVNTDESNVREGPSTDYDVMEVLNNGDDVFVRFEEDSWLNVGPERWIHSTLVS